MGIDVNLYAVGDVSDEQLRTANKYLATRGVSGWDQHDSPLERVGKLYPDRVEWRTLYRYYGLGYERGPWPQIHNAIVCLRNVLPHCTVFYGGDTSDDGDLVTDDMLAMLWRHWLGPDGDAYHRRLNAFATRLDHRSDPPPPANH